MTDLIDKQPMTIKAYIAELKKEMKGSDDEKNVIEIYNKEADIFGECMRKLQLTEGSPHFNKEFTYGDLNKYHNIFIDGRVVRGFMKFSGYYPVVPQTTVIFWISYFLNTDTKILAQNDIKVLSDAFMLIDSAIKNDSCVKRYERLYYKNDPIEWFIGTIGKLEWPFGLDEKKYQVMKDKYEIVFKGLTPTD